MMTSKTRIPKWALAALASPLVAIFLSAVYLNRVIPPFFAPDETSHFIWGFDPTQQEYQYPNTLPCNDLTRFVGAFDVNSLFRVRGEKFLGYEKILELMTAPLAEKQCHEFLPSHGYTGIYTYPQILLAKAWGSLLPDQKPEKNIINVYTHSRLLSVLLFLLLAGFAYLRFFFNPNPIHFLTYLFFPVIFALPIFLQQLMSVSSDVVVNCAALAIGLLLTRMDKSKADRSKVESIVYYAENIFLYPLILAGCLTKPILAGLVLGAAGHLFIRNRGLDKHIVALVVILLLTSLKGILFISYGVHANYQGGVNPTAQKEHILSHPFKAGWAIVSTSKVFGVFGSRLSWLSFRLSQYYNLPSFGLILIWIFLLRKWRDPLSSAWASTGFNNARMWNLAFWWLAVSSSALLVGLALYLGCTVPGANHVNGIQPRYYLAIWVFGVFSGLQFFRFSNKEANLNSKSLSLVTSLATLLLILQVGLFGSSIKEHFWAIN